MGTKVYFANGDEQYFFKARSEKEAMKKVLKLFDIELIEVKRG